MALVCVLAAVAYFVWIGYWARGYTLNTALPAYRDTHYPLALSDLSHRQVEILLKVEDPRFFLSTAGSTFQRRVPVSRRSLRLSSNAKSFAQASKVFFGRSFAQLNEDEYIALVAMLIVPATFDVKRYPECNRERIERIKRVVSGEYVPHGLFDVFYGKLDKDIQENIPPLSYFESYYQ